ncbi:hypothetical protein ILUMI_12339 [Ignelater luminosus]|uniref:L-Fucosyltransferase n=1 Tax=Ignelater luminosus TaxID=2038154 RepID=A0A8K0GCE3_IGNLU|nr:hypothetical protein ILUMI_12339 [Ignelater luminosus]
MFRLQSILVIIILLVLSTSVNIFLVLSYTANKTSNDLKTVAEFEKTLCSRKNINKEKKWKEQRCPPQGFVTVNSSARLGNQMWQYISVWGVAKRTGLDAYIPRCNREILSNAFDSLTVPTLDEISHCMVNVREFAKSLEEWNNNKQGIMIKSNAFLAEVALKWVEDVRKQFTFREHLVKKSQDILRTVVKDNTDKVFVGVHVRRTDYSRYLPRKYKLKLANVSFYYSAMKYYEDKYKNVVFILTSDDNKWCIKQFSDKSNVFVVGEHFRNSPYLDLAVLAACNHSIFDYGTYGGWSAILAGGETIFYKIKGALPERVAKLLPNWHTFR